MELRSFARTAKIVTLLGLVGLFAPSMRAQGNPGDPLFCDPNEGTTFLIVNGGAGVFTVNSDCYGNIAAADTQTVIPTGQGGVLTKGAGTSLNYVYTPPTPNFTGLDTFSILVTTVCNRAGGPGSAGNIGIGQCPGGPATLSMTLNVIPATMTVSTTGGGPVSIPIPTGAVTGCTPNVNTNSGTGPGPTQVVGCITGVTTGGGGTHPSNGTLTVTGSNQPGVQTVLYTPSNPITFSGDTFTVQVQGVNTDGQFSLNSGFVTVTVMPSQPVPTLGTWGMVLLAGLLMVFWFRAASQRMA